MKISITTGLIIYCMHDRFIHNLVSVLTVTVTHSVKTVHRVN